MGSCLEPMQAPVLPSYQERRRSSQSQRSTHSIVDSEPTGESAAAAPRHIPVRMISDNRDPVPAAARVGSNNSLIAIVGGGTTCIRVRNDETDGPDVSCSPASVSTTQHNDTPNATRMTQLHNGSSSMGYFVVPPQMHTQPAPTPTKESTVEELA